VLATETLTVLFAAGCVKAAVVVVNAFCPTAPGFTLDPLGTETPELAFWG
jgi:hypothetical protein